MSINVTSSAAIVDATDSVTLSATVTSDKNAAGVNWSVSGGGQLSAMTTSSATYTAPASSTTALTVTVTATSIADNTKTGTTTITVPAAPTITTTAMTAGTVGTGYTATLGGSGGIPPYSFTIINGALPAGLTMNAAGVISGAPMAGGAGTSKVTIQMTDSGKPTALIATAQLDLTVNAAPPIVFPTTLPTATFNAAYSASVAATGGAGALTYTLSAGALPTGLSLSAAGAITGTPTAAGMFPITVRASDAFGDSATLVYSLKVVYSAVVVTAITPPAGYVGSNYTQTTLAATGGSGTGYNWAVSSGSAMPAGLTLSGAGVITGKPTAAGKVSTNVTVTDSASNTGTATLTFTIDAALSVPPISTSLPGGYAGGKYSQKLTATGGSGTGFVWAVTAGASSLTSVGLSLAGDGTLSGNIPSSAAARSPISTALNASPRPMGSPQPVSITFTATVTDSASNTASATYTLTIAPGISITTSTTLPVAFVGVDYSQTLTATLGSGTGFTWAVTSGSTLPAGLTLSPAGILSGKPTTAGAYTFNITVTDSAANTAGATFSITVKTGVSITTQATLPTGYVGTAYSQTLAAGGGSGSGYTWTITSGGSTLSALGLSMSNGGVISGTPTAAGTATFTVSVTDSASNTASGTFTLPVNPALTISTPTTLSKGYVDAAYSATLAATGGSGSGYSWTVKSGSTLPGGLTLSTGGVLSGKPTTPSTPSFTVTVTDSASNTASATFSLTIGAGISISPTSLPGGFVGTNYSQTLVATGGSGTGYSWAVTAGSTLPGGLSLSTGGVLSGKPTTPGTPSFNITVTDSVGNTATATFSLTIAAGVGFITPTTLPTGYVGTAYSQSLAAGGGSGTGYTFAITSGGATLTALGLGMSNAGAISGTPTATGTATFTTSVTDSAMNTASATFTLVVNSGVTVTTTSPMPNAFVGSAYSQTLAASGGSGTGYTWTVTSGAASLAAVNLALSSGGVLSGTPMATGTPSFTVKVTDSVGNTATATLTLTVGAGVSITTPTTLTAGYQGTAYPMTNLSASGGTGVGYAWSWVAANGSSIPPGLSLLNAGVITGTPTSPGNFSMVVTVKDSAQNSASATFSLNVVPTLIITSPATLPSGIINKLYSQQLAANGGSGGNTWTVTAGASSLTALNLALSGGGLLSGTPASPGSASFTAKVTDGSNHMATASFSVTINASLAITTTSLPYATTSVAYSQTLAATGGTGAGYTWSALAGNNLANFNLSLSATGVLSGTPTSTGIVNFTAQVTDSGNNTATAPFSFAVYNPLSLPTTNPGSMPLTGTTGVVYSGNLSATGGSGNYSLTITGMPADGLSATTNGGRLNIDGTPTGPATVTFTAKVQDTTTNATVGPITYTITVTNPAPLVLPAANPGSLPAATIGTPYNGSVTGSGGIPPYSFIVNGNPVQTNSTQMALTNGLYVTNDGSGTLQVGGTPTTVGNTVTFTATLKDSLNATSSPVTYTVPVNAVGSQVSGQIFLNTNCGGGGSQPPITVTINTTPEQTTTTDATGNYSFALIPNGTFTITPSAPGASSIFWPATQTVTVDNSPVSGKNFSAELAYTVSGTVGYAGSQIGQVYVALNSNNCGGNNPLGTSTTAAGAFKIQGVPPGTYTLSVFMDTLGSGEANGTEPTGSKSPITVTSANVVGTYVTMTNPATYSLSSGPALSTISATDQGVVINFNAITTNSGNGKIELATSYTVQWSTSSSFTNPGSFTYKAGGANGTGVWLLNNGLDGLSGSFINGTKYYFRAFGNVGNVAGPVAVYGGATPTAVTIGAPTGGNTVSGQVTFAATPTGPMYVGFFDQGTGMAFGTRIASPVSPQAYSVQVPSGNNYFFFVILDQNNNGIIDPGDVTNTHIHNSSSLSIQGSTTENVTLPNAAATVDVTTQFQQNTNTNGNTGTTTSYSINFNVREGINLPVAATLTSGPNVINPVDIGQCGSNCGSPQFSYGANLGGNVPKVGDSYTFNVTYQDGTSDVLTGNVTTVLTASALATNLAPQGTGVSSKPGFSWTYPANAGSYIYQFQVCCGTTGTIWAIPNFNSNANGFTSAQIPSGDLAWGVDPTDATNDLPSGTSLSSGTTYWWQIQTQDSAGNSAVAQVGFETIPAALTLPSGGALTAGTVGQNYSGKIVASGGQGPGYNFAVNGSAVATNGTQLSIGNGLSVFNDGSSTLYLTGTPTAATVAGSPVSFTVKVTDSASTSVGPNTYTITINNAAPLSLPPANSIPALVNQPFSQSVDASGGIGPYVFTVNGTQIPTTGVATGNWNGLSAFSTGGSTLSFTGTPTIVSSVTMDISVTDSTSTTYGPVTYTVDVVAGPNGVNNGNLNGHYSCLIQGFSDFDGSRWATVTSLQADGNGHFASGGVFDRNSRDLFTGAESGTATGVYSIGADNIGLATITFTITAGGTGTTNTQFAFALAGATSPAKQFRMVESDDIGAPGSGRTSTANCYLADTTAFNDTTFSGNSFAFGLEGENGSGTPKINAGRFTASTGGAIASGFVDTANAGSATTSSTSLTGGSYTTPDATTGSATLSFTSSKGSVNFAVYIIDANRAFMLQTDAGKGAQAGNIRKQHQTSYSVANLNGRFVIYMMGRDFTTASGNTPSDYFSSVFEGAGDGAGNISINQSYMDFDGTYKAGQENGGPSAVTFDSTNPGRATFVPGPGSTGYLYFFNNNSAFEMDANSSGSLESGWVEPQSLSTYTDAAIAGTYMLGQLPVESTSCNGNVGQFALTSDGAVTGTLTSAGTGTFNWEKPTSLTYAWDATASGTGTYLLTNAGKGGASCAAISSTKSVCTLQSDSCPAVLILQQ